jgi:hypothetical protein
MVRSLTALFRWRTTMRLLAVLLLYPTIGVFAVGQDNTDPGTSCIERLRIPVYPQIAKAARLQGTVTATVLLSPMASVRAIEKAFSPDSQGMGNLFTHDIDKALMETVYRSDCGGKRVTLIFDFRIVGEPNDSPVEFAYFGYPNKFWITAEVHKPTVNRSALLPSK